MVLIYGWNSISGKWLSLLLCPNIHTGFKFCAKCLNVFCLHCKTWMLTTRSFNKTVPNVIHHEKQFICSEEHFLDMKFLIMVFRFFPHRSCGVSLLVYFLWCILKSKVCANNSQTLNCSRGRKLRYILKCLQSRKDYLDEKLFHT